MVFFLCSDPPPSVMESGGLLPLLRSAAAGESWESGEEWGEGAVRGGEANNCQCFRKQRGFSSMAPRVQFPPLTCIERAWLWRNCRSERSQRDKPRGALKFVRCRPNSVCGLPNRLNPSRAGLVGPHTGNQTRPKLPLRSTHLSYFFSCFFDLCHSSLHTGCTC